MALAEIDERVKTIQNVRAQVKMTVDLPEGSGIVNTESIIKNREQYTVEFAGLMLEPVPHMETGFVTTYKSPQRSVYAGKHQKGFPRPPKDIVRKLPTEFLHYLATSMIGGTNPFIDLATATTGNGWRQVLESKKLDSGEVQRLFLINESEPKRTYVFNIDPKQKLPTSFAFDVVPTKGKPTKVRGQIVWAKKATEITDAELSPKQETNRLPSGLPMTDLPPEKMPRNAEEAKKLGILPNKSKS